MAKTRTKYRFRTRQAAEDAQEQDERHLWACRLALKHLACNDFTWTEEFSAPGHRGHLSRWKMGLANVNAAHGGILLVWEKYGDDRQDAYQTAHYAEEYFAERQDYGYAAPHDKEAQAFLACFRSAKELHATLLQREP